jgi:PAS domain S-box-containing protein
MIHFVLNGIPYELNVLAIETLAVALGIIALGIFGLVREQGSQVSVVFSVMTAAMGLWLFGFSRMYGASDTALAMWWAKVAYVGIVCLPAAIYNFSALIVKDYEKTRKRVLAVWTLSVFFVGIILTTDLQFASLYRYSWGYYPQARAASVPFMLYFIIIMITTLRDFVAAYRSAARGSARRTRGRILLLTFAVGYLGAVDFIASFGVPWRPLGHVAMLVFLVISARSIFHHHFMTITPAIAARQIVDTMNDGLIVLDPDGIVRLVNRATCGLFGCREQDLVGKRPSEGMASSAEFARQLELHVGSGTTRDRQVELRLRDVALRTLSLSSSIMRGPAGETLAIVCVVSDISDRKLAEKEQEELITRLQTIDKMKSDFVSMVSHELRTPLTTIKAFAELIIMKPDMPSEERSRLMDIINAETDRLTRLISDILDLRRIESGSMKWRFEELSIDDVIRSSCASLGPLFESKGLAVTMALDSQHARLSGDRDRLVQVVTNILSNAVKFTPRGGSIHIAARRESLPGAQIVVEIADTGIGISAGDIELIFQRFQRSTEGHTDAIEGTGLGLAIARQIIEHHGGRIWAANRQGQGSVFTFTLPMSA